MISKRLVNLMALFLISALLLTACTPAATPAAPTAAVEPTKAPAATEFKFGLILVGPYNDHGWSEAHYQAGKYIESKIPGAKMVYVDNVNPGAKPGVTVPQLVDDLVGQGVKIVFTTSDDFKDGTLEAAIKHPDLPIVNVSGDHAWKDGKDFKAPKPANCHR